MAAPNISFDDNANVFTGLELGMEYNLNDTGWTEYDPEVFNDLDFTSTGEIKVRVAATDTEEASEEIVINFNVENEEEEEPISGPLSVIGLEDAKDELGVDFTDMDSVITRKIKAAISLVERYTGWALYKRNLTLKANDRVTEIPLYPYTITSVTNPDESPVSYKLDTETLSSYIYAPKGSIINLQVGASNVDDIDGSVLEACYRLVTYLYENRDAYEVSIPADIQLLLNQFRRNATI